MVVCLKSYLFLTGQQNNFSLILVRQLSILALPIVALAEEVVDQLDRDALLLAALTLGDDDVAHVPAGAVLGRLETPHLRRLPTAVVVQVEHIAHQQVLTIIGPAYIHVLVFKSVFQWVHNVWERQLTLQKERVGEVLGNRGLGIGTLVEERAT